MGIPIDLRVLLLCLASTTTLHGQLDAREIIRYAVARRRAQLEGRAKLYVPTTRGTPVKLSEVRTYDVALLATRYALPATGPEVRPSVACHRREEGAGKPRREYVTWKCERRIGGRHVEGAVYSDRLSSRKLEWPATKLCSRT